MAVEVTLDEFFEGFGETRPLFDCVCAAILTSEKSAGLSEKKAGLSEKSAGLVEQRVTLGVTQHVTLHVTLHVTKSQVAFRAAKQFAWVWIPARHLGRKAAPLVLSLALPHHDPSPRWKQIVEPAPGRFMHHLEIHAPSDIDEEVLGWIRQARANAE